MIQSRENSTIAITSDRRYVRSIAIENHFDPSLTARNGLYSIN